MPRTGRPPIGVVTKFAVDKDVLVELKALAAYRGEPVAATIRAAVVEFVARNKKSRRVA